MSVVQEILRVMDTQMVTPEPYGWFHVMWCVLSVVAAVLLCIWHKKDASEDRIRRVVLWVSVTVAVLEVYKLTNYSFSYDGGVSFDFQWYAFPFQFCSTPMYVGILAGLLKKGKVHDSLYAYLATYSLFAGVAVMVYPVSVFIGTVGINIQTMFCHGSMITLAIYLMYTGYVKLEYRTILKAMPVFVVAVSIASVMNEVAYRTGLLESETFNMFYISPYCDPHLPVYSLVQEKLAYPWCLIVYVIGFTLAAFIMLLLGMGIKRQGAKVNAHHTAKATV